MKKSCPFAKSGGKKKKAQKKKMQFEMDKWKEGTLHSGSKKGPLVKNRKQAIAIGLKTSGLSKKKKK